MFQPQIYPNPGSSVGLSLSQLKNCNCWPPSIRIQSSSDFLFPQVVFLVATQPKLKIPSRGQKNEVSKKTIIQVYFILTACPAQICHTCHLPNVAPLSSLWATFRRSPFEAAIHSWIRGAWIKRCCIYKRMCMCIYRYIYDIIIYIILYIYHCLYVWYMFFIYIYIRYFFTHAHTHIHTFIYIYMYKSYNQYINQYTGSAKHYWPSSQALALMTVMART
jgi:hypothetical protein